MKRKILIFIPVILAIVLVGLIIKNKFFGKPGLAGITVASTPKATVFIDGIKMGTTPYTNDKITAEEHTVKLVSEVTTDDLAIWEEKVKLTPDVRTMISRTLGSSETASSGETIWLERTNSKDKSSLSIVSLPDKAVIRIEGEPQGYAPFVQDNFSPGNYQIAVSATGYEEKSFSIKTMAGFRHIINVQLSKKVEGIQEATVSGEQTELVTPTAKITPKLTPGPIKPYVKIKETPTGWLRVRMAPSANATEAAKVEPGETFPYLNEEKSGWLKIEYEAEKEGWVSGTYVDLVK